MTAMTERAADLALRTLRSLVLVTAVGLAGDPAAAQQVSPGGTTGGFEDRPPTAAGSPATARLDARITQLEQDLRGVTGRVETLSYQVRQLSDKLERLSSDLELRLDQRQGGAAGSTGSTMTGQAETGGPRVLGRADDGGRNAAAGSMGAAPPATTAAPYSPPPPPAPPPPAPSAAAVVPPAASGSSKEQYAQAFALMQKSNYGEAGAAFADFLRRYPDDALADNARYWLGESYYARGDYANAAETFFDAYEKNKSGPKAPDTLLKLGMSLGSLDKKKEACATFRELARAFPNASSQVKDKAAQESKRLGCS